MGLFRRPLRALYLRWGERYPYVAVAAVLLVLHLVVAGGVALLTLYQRLSASQLWAIAAIAEGVVLLDNAFHARMAFRILGPVRAWLRGDRGEEASVAAWRALAGLPLDTIREHGALVAALNLLPVSAAVVLVLDLPAYAVLAVLAGAAVVLLYGVLGRYFATELVLRPVLEDISRTLPPGVEPGAKTIPLRWKLLAALPAINVITGVVAAGLAQRGHAVLSDLGIDVLVAVAVAFTLSFELTLLLSRSILEPIQDLRRATAAVARGDLQIRVPVVSNDETGALAGSFNAMVAGLAERERLREAFGMFVDPGLAERVLAEGTALEGEEVEVTVLFLDIRDFTAFAERAGPAEVVGQLNAFYELVVPVLVDHGGHANKFIGDGLLGVFGAPDHHPDHADRAVEAAGEILERVRAVYGPRAVGIGVNSGTVVAGTVGGGGHLEFTVIGDVVNTASRVEAITRETGDELLITEETCARLTRGRDRFEPRPEAAVRGRSQPVRLFAPPAGAAAAATPAPGPARAPQRLG